jgi:hypothetical protein
VAGPAPRWGPPCAGLIAGAGSAIFFVLAPGVVGLLPWSVVLEGIGTRAPIGPTEHFVIGGVYGYVRNPMPAGS